MTTTDREQPASPIAMPTELATQVEGRRWMRNLVGQSGGMVFRLPDEGRAPDLYLKYGKGPVAPVLADEMARLRWLAEHISVPAVRHFAAIGDEAWLLTEALPGQTAFQLLETSPGTGMEIADSLARFLRRLHAIPLSLCPFDSGHMRRLRLARGRLDAGLVDTEDFDDERRGWSGEEVWSDIQSLLPLDEDRVVTHGDFSLDNILFVDGEVVGCIDLDRAGIADRYQDLAILWNSLGEFGAGLQDRMMRCYGIYRPNERKLRFHLALDELF